MGVYRLFEPKRKIWATGVQVHEYLGPHSNHTKAVLIDDRLSIVGSYNLDMRSTYQDTELMLAIDSEALAAELREEIDRDKTYSRTMTDSGEYHYEENYHPREMSTEKRFLCSAPGDYHPDPEIFVKECDPNIWSNE